MTVGDRGGLAIAEIIFYVVALPISVAVALKHGFGRSAGWFFLIALSCSRLGGAIAELVAINTLTASAFTAAAILSNVGFSTLLAAQLGILKRLHEGMQRRRIDPRIFHVVLILIVVGLILSIVGGVDVYSSTSSPPSSSSFDYLRDAAIILVVAFTLLVLAVAWTFVNFSQTIKSDRILLYAVAASLPCLAVRDIFSILQAYQVDPSRFSSSTGSVVVYAFMAIFMEFVVVILYLGAGWLAPKINRTQVQAGNWYGGGQRGDTQAFPSKCQ